MKRYCDRVPAVQAIALLLAICAGQQGRSQEAKTRYPKMAPLEEYLMDRNAEIVLARSAAPPSLSQDAEILVLGRHGYESAVKGSNGFVCVVQRSWTAGSEDSDFWNPKLRGPACFNPPAVRSYLPIVVRRTELALGGSTKEQMITKMGADFDKKALPLPEPNSMCYMLSAQGYLGDENGHWHPHLMFFLPRVDLKAWGAEAPGSPIVGIQDLDNRMTVLLIPVGRWSDGTPAPPM